jgi:hypothetical protein
MLSKPTVEGNPISIRELSVRSVSRQWMAKIDDIPLSVAYSLSAEPDDGFFIARSRELSEVTYAERTSRDSQPIDDRMLLTWKISKAVAQ